jgi:hypothetical protein
MINPTKIHPLPEVLLLVMVVAGISGQAQAGGIGLQIATVNNSLSGALPNEGSWDGRRGLGASLLFEVDLTPDIALSFQPGYTPRNSRQEFKNKGEVTGFLDYDLDYVTLPLLVRVTGEPLGVRGFVTAGVEFSILQKATVEAEERSIDITDGLNELAVGALFGGGALVPVGRHFLVFELRYTQGLDDIVARDNSAPETGLTSPSVKFRGITLEAGFLIKWGGG